MEADLDRESLYDAEADYERALERIMREGSRAPDYGAYMPSPEDILRRKHDLVWMQVCGFGPYFIASVMQFECPTINFVRNMVEIQCIHPDDVARRLRPFLEITEYEDNDED